VKIPILNKYYGGSYLGGILDTYGRASMIISGIQFMFVVVILYTTSASPYFELYAPWMTFTMYLLISIVSILVLLIITRLLIVPSAYTFYNKQVWTNNNPIRDKLEKLEENQKKIMEKLGIEGK